MIRYSKLNLGPSHPSWLLYFLSAHHHGANVAVGRSDLGEPFRSPMQLKVLGRHWLSLLLSFLIKAAFHSSPLVMSNTLSLRRL